MGLDADIVVGSPICSIRLTGFKYLVDLNPGKERLRFVHGSDSTTADDIKVKISASGEVGKYRLN